MNSLSTKIAVIGAKGVGKSAYIHRIATGECVKDYVPTSRKVSTTLKIGEQEIEVDAVEYGESDNYIVLFDVTDVASFDFAMDSIAEIRTRKPYARIVLCGNKVDLRARVITPTMIRNEKVMLSAVYGGFQYYDLSVFSNYNWDLPFRFFIR